MIMTRIFPTLVFSLFFLWRPFAVQAQEGFTPGLIVTATGDTLKGLIWDQDWQFSNRQVQFKASKDAPIQSFKPEDAPWFYANGQWYAGKAVLLDKSPHQPNKLTYSNAPVPVRDTIFIRAFVLGKAKLFYCVDENQKPHFLIGKDSVEADELILRKYLVAAGGRERVVTLEKFRGQLSYYFSDCPELEQAIRKVQYIPGRMIDLFSRYNKCVGGETAYAAVPQNTRLRFDGVLTVGIALADLKMDAPAGDPLSGSNFSSAVRPVVGYGLNMFFPWQKQQWSIYSELAVRFYGGQAKTRITHNPDYYDDYDLEIKTFQNKLTVALRFQRPEGAFRPFFMLGGNLRHMLWIRNLSTKHQYFYGLEDTSTGKALYSDIRVFEYGLTGAAGLSFRRFSLELRFDSGNGLSEVSSIPSSTSTYGLLLGCTF